MTLLAPTTLALLAGLFTWGCTVGGSALVLRKTALLPDVMSGFLGLAAGIMIAASFWSLLVPAITLAESLGMTSWKSTALGFLMGGFSLKLLESLMPGPETLARLDETERWIPWKRGLMLFVAVTVHNIPEGLAIGVAFSVASETGMSGSLAAAMALTLGVGIQNIPEAAAVSIPLKKEGLSRSRAFWFGQLSGMVQPVCAVLGAALALILTPILPFVLSFAAGAMMFVVVAQLIPDSRGERDQGLGSVGAILGFTLMMCIDLLLH